MMFEELGGHCFSLTAFSYYIRQLAGEVLDVNPDGSHFSEITCSWLYEQEANSTQCRL